MALPVQIVSEDRTARIDSVTNVLSTIDYEHHEIHEGSFFRAHLQVDVTGGLGENTSVVFTTPNSLKLMHFIWSAYVEQETVVSLHEGATYTANSGDAFTPLNANRASKSVSAVVDMRVDATVNVVPAVELERLVLGAGGSELGETRGVHEWILKPNTVYVIQAVNNAAGADQVSLIMNWYEHTSKTS